MKIVSWNVNGIAACRRKGFLKFLADAKPDIVCCQEIKTRCSLNTPGYTQFWNPSKKTKCSGTLTLVRKLPLSCSLKMGIDKFDDRAGFGLGPALQAVVVHGRKLHAQVYPVQDGHR